MNVSAPIAINAAQRGSAAPHSLERRRLQCYLALLLGDLTALFVGVDLH